MLSLTAGKNSVVVAPEHGGGIIGWLRGATPMLRRALPAAALGGTHAMGAFPLLPYGNRIAGGRFVWAGTAYQLKLNFGDHPNAIHGVGWQRTWHLVSASATSATMVLEHRPDASWPFAFQASLQYAVDDGGLTAGIALMNRHDGPAPAGIGLHPYFSKAHDPALRFDASGAWRNDAMTLPLEHGPVPADWDHHQSRRVAESRLDNCFTGWGCTAEIHAGPASLRIQASEVFGNFQVFTPHWADFWCAEPVSHAPDAINRPGLPPGQAMRVLAPGETLSGTVRFEPFG